MMMSYVQIREVQIQAQVQVQYSLLVLCPMSFCPRFNVSPSSHYTSQSSEYTLNSNVFSVKLHIPPHKTISIKVLYTTCVGKPTTLV